MKTFFIYDVPGDGLAILKMNLHCFSAVLQFLSNETDNGFVQ
jgi:hypothetical protein